MPLTDRQQKFAEARARGLTKFASAVLAGYSEATAMSAGSRLAKHPGVALEIKRLKLGKAEAPRELTKAEEKKIEPIIPDGQALDALMRIYKDPADFLRAVMNDTMTDVKTRTDAAKALMPFEHARKGEGGKKEAKQDAAEKVASRFSAGAPPRLAAAGGKKV